jgi:hypothetical protein
MAKEMHHCGGDESILKSSEQSQPNSDVMAEKAEHPANKKRKLLSNADSDSLIDEVDATSSHKSSVEHAPGSQSGLDSCSSNSGAADETGSKIQTLGPDSETQNPPPHFHGHEAEIFSPFQRDVPKIFPKKEDAVLDRRIRSPEEPGAHASKASTTSGAQTSTTNRRIKADEKPSAKDRRVYGRPDTSEDRIKIGVLCTALAEMIRENAAAAAAPCIGGTEQRARNTGKSSANVPPQNQLSYASSIASLPEHISHQRRPHTYDDDKSTLHLQLTGDSNLSEIVESPHSYHKDTEPSAFSHQSEEDERIQTTKPALGTPIPPVIQGSKKFARVVVLGSDSSFSRSRAATSTHHPAADAAQMYGQMEHAQLSYAPGTTHSHAQGFPSTTDIALAESLRALQDSSEIKTTGTDSRAKETVMRAHDSDSDRAKSQVQPGGNHAGLAAESKLPSANVKVEPNEKSAFGRWTRNTNRVQNSAPLRAKNSSSSEVPQTQTDSTFAAHSKPSGENGSFLSWAGAIRNTTQTQIESMQAYEQGNFSNLMLNKNMEYHHAFHARTSAHPYQDDGMQACGITELNMSAAIKARREYYMHANSVSPGMGALPSTGKRRLEAEELTEAGRSSMGNASGLQGAYGPGSYMPAHNEAASMGAHGVMGGLHGGHAHAGTEGALASLQDVLMMQARPSGADAYERAYNKSLLDGTPRRVESEVPEMMQQQQQQQQQERMVDASNAWAAHRVSAGMPSMISNSNTMGMSAGRPVSWKQISETFKKGDAVSECVMCVCCMWL